MNLRKVTNNEIKETSLTNQTNLQNQRKLKFNLQNC